jgi:hypothetical protein
MVPNVGNGRRNQKELRHETTAMLAVACFLLHMPTPNHYRSRVDRRLRQIELRTAYVRNSVKRARAATNRETRPLASEMIRGSH